MNNKLLEHHIEKYLVKDLALLRNQLFKDKLFVSNQEIHDFMESHGDSIEDSYLIIHSLAERGIIHQEKQKDRLGRVLNGFVLHNPKSQEYTTHLTVQKLKDNLAYIDTKIQDLESSARLLHDKIKANLVILNKEAARVLGRDKLGVER